MLIVAATLYSSSNIVRKQNEHSSEAGLLLSPE